MTLQPTILHFPNFEGFKVLSAPVAVTVVPIAVAIVLLFIMLLCLVIVKSFVAVVILSTLQITE